ncbi:MAG: ATP-binding cassette domain-containing protein, partial [Acutalibacteraceae bacterium]|nr:ATP-binding cassette domain-containing protein [Acutalibacteraceae bacterium]
MTVLSFQNLAFSFGERELFRNVNFEINDKEKVGFIGSNGVGKTTILKLIRGELEPTEGAIVTGKEARLGYMEQHTCSKKGMTLYDELIGVFDDLISLEIEINQVNYRLEHNLGDMEDDLRLQDELTTKFNNGGGLTFRSRTRSALLGLGFTEDDFNLTTDKLSGGQRSKVALAKLLLSKSNLLLL